MDAYVAGIKAGDHVTLSRAITLVESTHPEDRRLASAVVEACLPDAGGAMRIGITGIPGVGKSTLIEALGQRAVADGHGLAVLAVDPSSLRTRGSILGDKTRMDRLSRNEAAFIRPSPTAGSLGGVAQATRESMLLCEAAGFDVIFVETTGVGQAEYTVRGMVDFFLLLVLAGAGDELQGIKRGIVEVVDAVAVTKADGPNREAAEAARTMHQRILDFLFARASGWKPPALTCSALEGPGVDELWQAIGRFFEQARKTGALEAQRQAQAEEWMFHTIEQRLHAFFYTDRRVQEALPTLKADVQAGRVSPRMAAERLLALYRPTTPID